MKKRNFPSYSYMVAKNRLVEEGGGVLTLRKRKINNDNAIQLPVVDIYFCLDDNNGVSWYKLTESDMEAASYTNYSFRNRGPIEPPLPALPQLIESPEFASIGSRIYASGSLDPNQLSEHNNYPHPLPSKSNKGVQPLLDRVLQYLPCPVEVNSYALDQTNNEEKVMLSGSPDGHLLVLAFKLEERRFGQLTYFRIYKVIIKKGDFITNVITGKKVN